ncbi:hypothetical protein RUND412_008681 [Rhizina undulata]
MFESGYQPAPAQTGSNTAAGLSGSVGASKSTELSLANLGKWDVQMRTKALPARDAIKAIHVYDFDNTLFMTPLPNSKIWSSVTLGLLHNISQLANGGWWHDPRILAATGDGADVEEPRAWKGWWNEQIVSLVELSMLQKDALTVLLTGRSVRGFSPLIQRMVASRKLEFDIIALKPEAGPNGETIRSTLDYKCMFLEDLIKTYTSAEEIRVYEDRPKHAKSFEDFFEGYIASTAARAAGKKPLVAEVIQVADNTKNLKPVVEVAEIQKMLDDHNEITERQIGPGFAPLQIKKTVFYTGYLVSQATTARILKAFNFSATDSDMKFMANNVMISPRSATQHVIRKCGSFGTKVEFEIVGYGHYDNRVWACLVKPTDPSAKVYTENPQLTMVLATRGNARPHDSNNIKTWQPVPGGKRILFSSIVGEKMLLRIEEENMREGEWESRFPISNKRSRDGETVNRHYHHHHDYRRQHQHDMSRDQTQSLPEPQPQGYDSQQLGGPRFRIRREFR